jgi:hypothetical protein
MPQAEFTTRPTARVVPTESFPIHTARAANWRERHSPLYLDVVEDGILLVDHDGFWSAKPAKMSRCG